MALSNSVLAFVLAMVTVLSLSLPSIVPLFHSPDSALELSHPLVRGDTLYLMATNTGDRPGVIEAAAIGGEHFRMTVASVDPATPGDTFVRPGSQQVQFKITMKLGYLDAALKALEAHSPTRKPQAPATVQISIRQARGEQSVQNFELSGLDLFEIFTAHAQRCEAQVINPTPSGPCEGMDELRRRVDQHAEDVIAKLRGSGAKPSR